MSRSLGSFYDRPGTPVCPDRRCVDEQGDRSVMVEADSQVFECPNAHGKRRVVRRDPRPFPDLPRFDADQVNRPINRRAREVSSPFGPVQMVEPASANNFAIQEREKRRPNASYEEIVAAYRDAGSISAVQKRLRVGYSTVRKALVRAGVVS